MPRWRPINPDDYDQSNRIERNGIWVENSTSPYDLPEQMRVIYDSNKGDYIVEFKYLAEESKKLKEGNGLVDFITGQNSKRLYSVIVSPQALHGNRDSDELKATILEQLNSVSSGNVTSRPDHLNQRLIERLSSSDLEVSK